MLILSFFFFNDTATTEIYTLSLHDALPIFALRDWIVLVIVAARASHGKPEKHLPYSTSKFVQDILPELGLERTYWYCRSEEHTSELQSHLNLVCRLLLEKKKENNSARY